MHSKHNTGNNLQIGVPRFHPVHSGCYGILRLLVSKDVRLEIFILVLSDRIYPLVLSSGHLGGVGGGGGGGGGGGSHAGPPPSL